MQETIRRVLEQIAREHCCQVLFASETGSRAWGFASPDSDYDVRFVYVHPLPWYLRLEQRRDTIELMTPEGLDLSGWELGKALRLFAGCNVALNEWLDSPTVYHAQRDFNQALLSLIPRYFNPHRAARHYLSMANKASARPEPQEKTIKIKRVFYVLRALLACRWIVERREMPPMRFDRLLSQPLPEPVLEEIHGLLARKAVAAEGETVELPPAVAEWIAKTHERASEQVVQLPGAGECDWEPLNRLYAAWVTRAEIPSCLRAAS